MRLFIWKTLESRRRWGIKIYSKTWQRIGPLAKTLVLYTTAVHHSTSLKQKTLLFYTPTNRPSKNSQPATNLRTKTQLRFLGSVTQKRQVLRQLQTSSRGELPLPGFGRNEQERADLDRGHRSPFPIFLSSAPPHLKPSPSPPSFPLLSWHHNLKIPLLPSLPSPPCAWSTPSSSRHVAAPHMLRFR